MDSLPLAPFDSMTADDYRAVGLRCGLEVHQQLLTQTKLFCHCPAGRYTDEYDAEIVRHMRPTLSEMGEYDGTALMEKKTRKNIYYHIHHDTVCTYEFDDTPPFLISDEAIDIALKLALLLQLNLVDELHIARKQYLDGSIPTGFQRTTILGIDGWLPYREGRIGIRQLSLEEDSCREVSDQGHDRVYLTDRLGMPLIEVVTDPDMRTPQQCADVCRIISNLCRSTQAVRRGYGATRQDVNVSVAGGTRIEIKGVPQIWRIPRLIYNEASRQVALLRIRDELHRRGITEETFAWAGSDVTRLLGRTSYAPIRSALDAGRCVRCVVLRGFAGLLNTTTQEHTTFAKEFSDRVRVIACLTELPNLIHSDLAAESLWAGDWQKLRRRLKADDRDALLLVWGPARDAESACEEIAIRAREATIGVPSDTRQGLKDGTNGFERVLPGAERMYPDTDLPPLAITPERIARLRTELPEPVWETQARFRAAGMLEDDIRRTCISPRAPLARRIIDELHLSGKLVGVVLGQRMIAFRRDGLGPDRLTDEAVYVVLRRVAEGGLPADAAARFVESLLRDNGAALITGEDAGAALDARVGAPLSEGEVEAHLDAALGAADHGRFATEAKLERYVMGFVMRELIGRVPGREVRHRLRARLFASSRQPRAEGANR